jgi:D-alanyl-lipoteichoic acid acyltransferase DltB (MBOAT superfamily)
MLLKGVNMANHLPYLTILLPIGLSFHTFQAMSYTIEVYRGHQKAERNFGIYSLYVMFYPQLVAGPIERPQNLLHQFREEHSFEYQRVVDGFKLMAWGLFKKMVIADQLSTVVNAVYDQPHAYHGLNLLIATWFFAFQIFCDFSGYTDIAIGAAKVMGFTLMKNFNSPYHAVSIRDFWRRWHISLSTWFKDYLYAPLGANRIGIPRWYLNLFVVFLISGLWHGSNWTYIIWGALNGFYLIFALITQNVRNKIVSFVGINKLPRLYHAIQILVTFILIDIAWVFFRAHSVKDAIYILQSICTTTGGDIIQLLHWKGIGQLTPSLGILSKGIAVILLLELVHNVQKGGSIIEPVNTRPWFIRWGLYYLFVFTLLYLSASTHAQFIYFQF